ncbi:MAG TPA: 2-C-methyl-D-erythritol 4-phosphate cytidylyltransferase [Gemmatimonadales bacterium]|nr:2-C-methyl-D-erythritol 4-phosphate cytidylyltransferase [Gemmatimonadales bacterium]
MPRDVGVVVVAAGRGARLGGDTPKQYQPIGGVPMVLRAVRAFTTHPDVAQVALVLPLADAESPPPFLRGVAGAGLLVVAGGAERADSVAAGLRVLDAACTVVLVHDAARPFVERGVIDAVIAHARSGEGAVAALRVSDTLKQAAAEDPTRIDRTVPRDNLWRAQTPQGFPRSVLERAHAAADARSATDDAALVERTGLAVRLVPDSPINMKVTTAEDLALAELLAGRVG